MANVKGSVFVKVVKSLRARRDRAEPLLPESLRHYLDKRILVSEWFPEEDYFEFMKVVAQLLPPPGMDVWEYLGRDAARVDYEGLYQSAVKGKSPERALRGVASLWPLRHDSGQVKIEAKGPGQATVELNGYAMVADELMRAVQGTLWQTLDSAGAKGITVTRTHSPSLGDLRCSWDVSWEV